MDNTAQAVTSPKEGLWNRFLLLIPLTIALVVGSYLYMRTQVGFYTSQTIFTYSADELETAEVRLSNPGVVEVDSITPTQAGTSTVRVRFKGLADGETEAIFITAEGRSETWWFEVRNGTVIEGGINFEGWQVIQLSLCIFLGCLCLLFASGLVKLWRASWYGYSMVACGGGLLFCLFQFVLYTVLGLVGGYPNFYFFLIDVTYMVEWFAAISVYFMIPLAVLVSISNIALIRHEGFRPVNLLGIAASIVWVVAYTRWAFDYDMRDGIWVYVHAMLPVAITYGECLLLSTMLCAWLSSRHVPRQAMDYLVILGCGIRADGTPCPLLAGRVDKAADFDEAHVAAGDSPAVFVPSGGQGPDEPVSEAQSMGEYLVTQRGVPRDRIALEDRSTTTRENMAYSREVIERHAGRDASELKIAFSTTNYHVFRGYVCAHQAGMAVEGMGAKTKYYFWPNAFLREFIGLLVTRWKGVLQTFIVVGGFYMLVTYALKFSIGWS
ncbi:MAG: YdcF family protein [Atopobiaceae bacterium]|nr:YdcF family protein [Atopobiaceae bacterium]